MQVDLIQKLRETALVVALNGDFRTAPQILEALIQAADSDLDGKLIEIYKRLGGAIAGRRLISKLKDTPWKNIEPKTRKDITELSKAYTLA